jgi:hypothetical protein
VIRSRLPSRHLLTAARIAWILIAVASVALYIGAMPRYYHQALTLTNQDGFIPRNPTQWRDGLHQLGLSPGFYAIYAVIGRSMMALSLIVTGVVIVSRRSRDWFALFLTASLLVFGCTTPPVSDEYAHTAIAPLVQIFSGFGQSFLLILYLFPDGRFVPRWTRWTAIVLVASFVVPYSGAQTAILLFFGVTLLFAPIYRYRYVATPDQRQQMKWAVVGLTLAVIVIIVDILLYPAFPELASTDRSRVIFDFVTLTAVVIAFSLVPVFIGIAILRYKLWEIDTLVNRTLVYGSLTISLASVYIAGVIALEALAQALTGQTSDLAIAAVTLAVAALFNPWRRRLQAFIDQRFYRRRYDATRILAAFNTRLRDEVDLDHLSADLVGVIQDTVEPAQISLWLKRGSMTP